MRIMSTYIGLSKNIMGKQPWQPNTFQRVILSLQLILSVGSPLPGLVRSTPVTWYPVPGRCPSCMPPGTHFAPVLYRSSSAVVGWWPVTCSELSTDRLSTPAVDISDVNSRSVLGLLRLPELISVDCRCLFLEGCTSPSGLTNIDASPPAQRRNGNQLSVNSQKSVKSNTVTHNPWVRSSKKWKSKNRFSFLLVGQCFSWARMACLDCSSSQSQSCSLRFCLLEVNIKIV